MLQAQGPYLGNAKALYSYLRAAAKTPRLDFRRLLVLLQMFKCICTLFYVPLVQGFVGD